jgi:pimeloyl-ACP methyl ester carboxylesterase
MSASAIDHFVPANGIGLHLVEHPGVDPPIIMLPGLSANARVFDGLVGAGLAGIRRVIAFDLRGRGQSGKPATGYKMADHAADVLAALDYLGLERVVLGGHSFGGALTLYLGATAPERFGRLLVLDAGLEVHPDVAQMIAPSLARLKLTVPSEAIYLNAQKAQPFLDGFWDGAIEGYYRAEIEHLPDGSVRARTSADAVAQALQGTLEERWDEIGARVRQPVLLVNAAGGFGPPGAPPLVPRELADRTAARLANAALVSVGGNHITMLYGEHAKEIVRAVRDFLE